MKITTKVCCVCEKRSEIDLDITEDQYTSWKNGAFIQDAMPNLRPDERELLITGTHSDCWDSLFAEDYEEARTHDEL